VLRVRDCTDAVFCRSHGVARYVGFLALDQHRLGGVRVGPASSAGVGLSGVLVDIFQLAWPPDSFALKQRLF
jgi:hypothetical protein